ncbi:uncharacterized protein B0J16DRAFT_30274 [Fusarium flagelliforme]|uniref:Uncharacterized protein n=1 Tax=Fusarium flagelliforme TaxID=2675880 RepID=A0A395N6G2_9HYPO|nr:uncharacterized protein B0J16DRAFT_30274 [Fusarium flagelliforme]KAH7197926.1 hypothetical protein B0J16DRAFT_30274 [Fusarium flagelliforme]RFN55373.1 hypothetical protein FIE12Z_409 [Fusarium flagelliforme]
MVSTQFLTGVLALLAANAVSAGPCKPSPSSTTVYTTTTVETTATEISSATVSVSFTEAFTSLGSTETINSFSTSAETSTALGTSTTLLTTTTEEPTSSVAASATTSAAAAECTTNADCDGATPFCDAGTCVATDPNVECSTNSECLILYGGDAPFCSTSGNCIGCRGDGDCYGETPYCDNDFCDDAGGHFVAGVSGFRHFTLR